MAAVKKITPKKPDAKAVAAKAGKKADERKTAASNLRSRKASRKTMGGGNWGG